MRTVIIIVGAARSGSTLLAKAIGGHSSCFTLGEINRFNQEINNPDTHCGCGKKLNKCDFWIQTLKDLNIEFGDPVRETNMNFSVGIYKQITKINKIYKLIPTLLFNKKYFNKDVETEIKNTFIIYEKIFQKTNSSVLVDSTKGLFRALILNSKAPNNIQFKFVQLTRDGRGVLNSSLKTSYSVLHNDGVIREYKAIENKDTKKIINSWMYINIRNFLVLKLLRKKQSMFIKYEDFTKNPEKYLTLIYKKNNLLYENSVLNLGINENHIMGGNASRMNAKKIKKQDEAWRSNLDKNILENFSNRAGWFNKILGYK